MQNTFNRDLAPPFFSLQLLGMAFQQLRIGSFWTSAWINLFFRKVRRYIKGLFMAAETSLNAFLHVVTMLLLYAVYIVK